MRSGKSLAGSTDKSDSRLPSRVDLASSGAGSSGGVMIRSEPFMCITGCSSQYFLNSCSYFLHPSPDSTTLLPYCGESSICSFVTSVASPMSSFSSAKTRSAGSRKLPASSHPSLSTTTWRISMVSWSKITSSTLPSFLPSQSRTVVPRISWTSSDTGCVSRAVVSHECLPLRIDLQTQESVERAANQYGRTRNRAYPFGRNATLGRASVRLCTGVGYLINA